MIYKVSELKKLLPKMGLLQTDIAAEQSRNKYSNNQERILRALSWLHAAEKNDNVDMRLICSLIALNAMYAVPTSKRDKAASPEKQAHNSEQSATGQNTEKQKTDEYELINSFIVKVLKSDKSDILISFLAKDYRDDVETILSNQYLSIHYWRSGAPGFFNKRRGKKEWYKRDGGHIQRVEMDLHDGKPEYPLEHVVHRVRVLRNQLLHGEAGYGDYYNRAQVAICAKVMLPLLGRMLFIMIKAMINHPTRSWGVVPYPPQGEKPNERTFLPMTLHDLDDKSGGAKKHKGLPA